LLMKLRSRYLALKVDSPGRFSSREIMEALWSALLRLFGEYGASRTGLRLIDYDEMNHVAIVHVFHKEVETIRAAVASITQIESKPAAVHIIAVSGTIKALRTKLKANAKRISPNMQQ